MSKYNMLGLYQKERHLSIKSLEAPQLPKLTVLTGVNGSGKSHLLSGIRDGKITAKISDVEVRSDEIRLISAPDFLNQAEAHREKVSGSQVDRFWQILEITINHYCKKPNQDFILENMGLSKNKYYKKHGIELKGEDKFIQITEEENGAIRRVEKHINELPIILHEDIESYIESYSKNILNSIRTAEIIVKNNQYNHQNKHEIPHIIAGLILENNDPIKKVYSTLNLISKILGTPICLVKEDEFRSHIPNEYQLNPFDRSFTSWFVEYREEYRKNSDRKDDHEDDSSVSFFEIDEFEQRFGKKPWKEMDSILKVLGIDLSFIPPVSGNLENYVARLKNGTGDIISTNNISSGEKVILSLISSIKYSLLSDFSSNFPKLILLDEPDAHLHPKFASILIEMLQEITEQRDDLYCIIVTHSPTTVALADNSEIFYIKNEKGNKFISPINKETMLSVLTYGLPSLNISTKNARQIYVEGEEDKEIYHLIHDRYRDFCLNENLETPKTYLNFLYHGINSGAESKGGVSGCSSVKSQVSALRNCGADTVYGVVDWDLQKNRKTNDEIFVIGNQTGYSIENFILHPLIVLLYLSSINRDIDLKFLKSNHIKTSVDITESSIAALPAPEQQTICSNFCSYILDQEDFSEHYTVKLIGLPHTLDIPKVYRDTKGHDLDKLIIKKIPYLMDDKELITAIKNKKKNMSLSLCAAKFVLARHQKFIPREFIDFFEDVP